mmetsp:Transcript_34408/g.89041  ORF Transcript_34408/g.89041 Transcript_34408/m.89041 type:complete len:210 (+) Transcript_34408:1702-2331(+)
MALIHLVFVRARLSIDHFYISVLSVLLILVRSFTSRYSSTHASTCARAYIRTLFICHICMNAPVWGGWLSVDSRSHARSRTCCIQTVKEGFKEPFWVPTIFETGLNRFLKLKNGVSALSAALNISIVAVGALAALTLQIILGGSNTPDVELGVSIATGVVCSLFVLDQIQLAPLIGIEVYAQVYTSASKSGILLVPSRIARVMKKMESK